MSVGVHFLTKISCFPFGHLIKKSRSGQRKRLSISSDWVEVFLISFITKSRNFTPQFPVSQIL